MTEEDDIDGLAAEYALGSLDVAERKQVAARRKTDVSLHDAIESWQNRLAPLSQRLPDDLSPPPHLLDTILSAISEREAQPSRFAEIIPLRRNSGRWRPLAIGASALAACLALAAVVWFVYTHHGKPPTQLAAMDCGGLYKDFWRNLDHEKYARISAEQLAGVSRMALRAYDACQAGDELDANAVFGRLRRMQF
jgi:anti-sigma-K factor RskA